MGPVYSREAYCQWVEVGDLKGQSSDQGWLHEGGDIEWALKDGFWGQRMAGERHCYLGGLCKQKKETSR